MPPIVSVVGRSGAGKTTFLEQLIPVLKARGLRVATVKHDVHGFEMDREGKDTWRHARAGADAVLIGSPRRLALLEQTDHAWSLAELVALLGERVDLVLTEGFKQEAAPGSKIEVVRAAVSPTPLSAPGELLALVADLDLRHLGVPCFALDDAAGVAELVLAHTGLAPQPAPQGG